MFAVVPLIELGIGHRIDIHRCDEQCTSVRGGGQVAGEKLFALVAHDPAAEPEFNEWYNAEHLPQLADVPGVLCARRYTSSADDRERKYLALYHLTGPEVSRSDAWSKAADTEWTRRVRPHFRDMLVLRCKRYVRR